MKIYTEIVNLPRYLLENVSRAKPSKSNLLFISALEKNREFQIFIQTIREDCGVPQNGFDMHKPGSELEPPNYKDQLSINMIWAYSRILAKYYNLPITWVQPFFTIITYNQFIEPLNQSIPIEIGFNRGVVLVTIKENIGFRKILKEIKSNKAEIEKFLKQIPTKPKKVIRDLEIKERMNDLRISGMSLGEVGSVLKVEYGDIVPFETDDYNIIGAEISRFRKKINKEVIPPVSHLKVSELTRLAKRLAVKSSESSERLNEKIL